MRQVWAEAPLHTTWTAACRRDLHSEGAKAVALLSRTASRISEAELAGALAGSIQPAAFNLFCEALSERTRFAYAVFLLNKVLPTAAEQHLYTCLVCCCIA